MSLEPIGAIGAAEAQVAAAAGRLAEAVGHDHPASDAPATEISHDHSEVSSAAAALASANSALAAARETPGTTQPPSPTAAHHIVDVVA